ncbi:sodium:solute symporter [Streptomyces azureus]|uniref:Sodium:solute symporter n=1 Tax=Streptomyces azureus TaxID=146537 RepID=A0A0K8PFJ6_STRAJ|nr:sodium:solute symporter [Streptomyces azureus]
MAVDYIVLMATHGILANEPVHYGLLASLAGYLAVSLATPATDAAVLAAWRERLAGRPPELASERVTAHQ